MPTDESTVDEGTDTSSDTSSGDEPEAYDNKEEKGQEGGDVKVPEQFQKEATALVQSCATVACLDFLQNEVSEMRQKLMSSQKKSGLNTDNFSADDMPSSE